MRAGTTEAGYFRLLRWQCLIRFSLFKDVTVKGPIPHDSAPNPLAMFW